MSLTRKVLALCCCSLFSISALACAGEERVRICAFNVHDLRETEVSEDPEGRVARLGEVLHAIDADIVLLSEVDTPPRVTMEVRPTVGELFVQQYLAPKGLRYRAFQIATNTGEHSGLDLDNNGVCDPKARGRDYAGDCWGYGEYPGQYGMVVLVREGFEAKMRDARTFKQFKWSDMPGAIMPDGKGDRPEWYDEAEAKALRLSSKNHADIPIELPGGEVIHLLCSHPTPPVFDGEEDRNGRRNHDEIRFWGDYVRGAGYMTDDSGKRGGLAGGEHFVILGDLNADPKSGDSRGNPVQKHLLENQRIANPEAPQSLLPVDRLDQTDTSRFRLRVDYVLPSSSMRIVEQRVWRGDADSPGAKPGDGIPMEQFPSDHYPVWVDLELPGGGEETGADG